MFCVGVPALVMALFLGLVIWALFQQRLRNVRAAAWRP